MNKTLTVGKLYSCDHYMICYPDVETAELTSNFKSAIGLYRSIFTSDGPISALNAVCKHWEKILGKPVIYNMPKVPFLILNDKQPFFEVLINEQKHCIIFDVERMDIYEIKAE